jgi:hypothetical protein
VDVSNGEVGEAGKAGEVGAVPGSGVRGARCGHGAWGIGHRAWGIEHGAPVFFTRRDSRSRCGHGAWGIGHRAWSMERRCFLGCRRHALPGATHERVGASRNPEGVKRNYPRAQPWGPRSKPPQNPEACRPKAGGLTSASRLHPNATGLRKGCLAHGCRQRRYAALFILILIPPAGSRYREFRQGFCRLTARAPRVYP